MPLYRFILRGRGIRRGEETGGFYTTRWQHGRTQDEAGERAIAQVREDWTTGASAHLADAPPTSIEIHEGWRIGIHELWSAPNKGNTFWFGNDDDDDDEEG